jgi:hypothetical protein
VAAFSSPSADILSVTGGYSTISNFLGTSAIFFGGIPETFFPDLFALCFE